MFEKFGEMESYKEINELAENLRQEGMQITSVLWQKKTGSRLIL